MSTLEPNAPRFTCMPACLRHFEAIVVALMDEDGRLVEANDGLLRLLGALDGAAPENIARYFIQPGWSTLTGTHAVAEQPVYMGVLNLGEPDSVCRSLRGFVQRRDRQLLLVAEFDVRELEALAAQVTRLNEAQADLQRELARSNRQLKRSEAHLRTLSITDTLTGLANRRHLEECIGEEITRARRYDTVFSLILADIDHFKRVNDTWGHDVGDAVLRAFAEMLREHVRDCDLVARLGGEEFIVLLPSTDLLAAQASAERLCEATRQLRVATFPEQLTASFGVTLHAPDDDLHLLLKRVDIALYEAKHTGRNRVVHK